MLRVIIYVLLTGRIARDHALSYFDALSPKTRFLFRIPEFFYGKSVVSAEALP